ncbi:MAG: hypothetical protein LUC22_05545 [Prevotella sp.]|nr:hypothetical protein [Prevotella sp.]
MTVRRNTNPRQNDLHPELQQILLRNGVQAHVVSNGGGWQLVVQGHDSPLLTYNITDRQAQALGDWGTNYANKTAYNTFTEIVAGDFDMPKDFVHARNANGRVAMGLHGYRIGTGEYGRGAGGGMLGWTPRRQDGFHLRRAGGEVVYQGTPMVAERSDGRMKPGELQSCGYGFYYKGRQTTDAVLEEDVLEELQTVVVPSVTHPRSTEPARPYNELITSPVYFTNEKWRECLSSHGIIIDDEEKTLTVQAANAPDLVYDLTDEELSALTSNSIEDVPAEQRLEVLNNVIKDDFANGITMDMLNSTDRIDISLRPEIEAELREYENQGQGDAVQVRPDLTGGGYDTAGMEHRPGDAGVNGHDLFVENDNKGWYREGAHGREVEIGDIYVEKLPAPEGSKSEATYRMTAIINGEAVSHEIKQRDYDKFLAVDDYHRMKLFSKVFKEVDMKTRPEARTGLGMRIFAALTASVAVAGEVVQDINHCPSPEIYGAGAVNAPRPYYKPGVDSPREIAARNFEAQANQVTTEIRRGY